MKKLYTVNEKKILHIPILQQNPNDKYTFVTHSHFKVEGNTSILVLKDKINNNVDLIEVLITSPDNKTQVGIVRKQFIERFADD
jgi:hypothetical protein